MESLPNLVVSISYTTRAKRAGEREGEAYHFVSDKRFKQMPDNLERSFAILLDRRDSLEWTRDKDGNLVELIRNSEGHFTCTKCGNHVRESTVDHLARRIQRYDISHDVMFSAWDTVDSIIERENAVDLARELSQ